VNGWRADLDASFAHADEPGVIADDPIVALAVSDANTSTADLREFTVPDVHADDARTERLYRLDPRRSTPQQLCDLADLGYTRRIKRSAFDDQTPFDEDIGKRFGDRARVAVERALVHHGASSTIALSTSTRRSSSRIRVLSRAALHAARRSALARSRRSPDGRASRSIQSRLT
jgi:hypothetical protein